MLLQFKVAVDYILWCSENEKSAGQLERKTRFYEILIKLIQFDKSDGTSLVLILDKFMTH